jgi:hypothetical protein
MSEEIVGLYREEDETWYEAGIRYTEQLNLDGAFEDYYYTEIRNGEDDFSACVLALEECGLSVFAEEQENEDA